MADETPIQEPMDTRLASINIEDEMSASYIDYSMSVIVGRALPDVRDGLKPVHRRVLFAMHELGNVFNKPHKKSARVVGDVIGKYHPHGDSAVYDTLVRMAQPFSLRYPLVDGQGNFGSIDGDPPAAMRYTEVRMDKLTDEMLEDIDKDTVDFRPNYNEEFSEPVVLPSKLPNLLLNGSTGIAVGMATNIPPHNLAELVDGAVHLVDHPDCSIDDLMQFIKGPDFPTGASICGLRGVEAMYKLGRGSMIIRGKADVIDLKADRQAIIITEIPYMVNKASMIERMAELVNEKQIEGISDIRDESKDDIRVVIELKRGAIAQVVLNNLYKHTQLQTSFGAIMLAIDQGRPKVMNLKEMLRCYLSHRFEVLTRRTKFELAKAEARRHILEGFLIALENLDEVVRVIRAAKNREEAKINLIARFSFSDKQVDAILEMRLYQLTGMEADKVRAEHGELLVRIEYLKGLLEHSDRIYGLIKADLLEIKEKYRKQNQRRTELVPLENEVNIEDLIADEACVITLSHRGYIKRVALTEYREQKRGGRGIKGAAIKEEDFIEQVFVAETHDTLLFFTSLGRLYAERAFEIQEAPRTSFGRPVVNMLELREGESIAAILAIRAFADDKDLVFLTERGIMKKTALSDYRNVRRSGINALNIAEGDKLLQVCLSSFGDEIVIITEKGRAVRFDESEVRRMGRNATGVRAVRLQPDDKVCAFDTVQPGAVFLITTENGYGLRTVVDTFRKTRRGSQGVRGINTGERNGKVVGAYNVKEDQSIVMITSAGLMVRSPVDSIRIIGRGSMGVRLLRLDDDAKLVSISLAEREEEDKAAVSAEEQARDAAAQEAAPESAEDDVVDAEVPETDDL